MHELEQRTQQRQERERQRLEREALLAREDQIRWARWAKVDAGVAASEDSV